MHRWHLLDGRNVGWPRLGVSTPGAEAGLDSIETSPRHRSAPFQTFGIAMPSTSSERCTVSDRFLGVFPMKPRRVILICLPSVRLGPSVVRAPPLLRRCRGHRVCARCATMAASSSHDVAAPTVTGNGRSGFGSQRRPWSEENPNNGNADGERPSGRFVLSPDGGAAMLLLGIGGVFSRLV